MIAKIYNNLSFVLFKAHPPTHVSRYITVGGVLREQLGSCYTCPFCQSKTCNLKKGWSF